MKRFLIDHIDPLGQGVYKELDQIYFIPKTLPGEAGSFEIVKSKKGVHFGKLIKLESTSPKREAPPCKYYDQCNGCHYQHTQYAFEKENKLKVFRKLLSKLSIDSESEIKVVADSKRTHYRNRIQLHYDKKKKLIGFHEAHSNNIINIKSCLIALDEINIHLEQLLATDLWLSKASRNKGHLEIYFKDGKIIESWDRPYANTGFTQVNTPVNELLKQTLKQYFENKTLKILDLFGGAGNLTKELNYKCKTSIDLYPDQVRTKEFFHLDLSKEDAIQEFSNHHDQKYNTFIIDPPRSGFKHIKSWVNQYRPDSIFYVSCQPDTMIRDIHLIQDQYQISKIFYIEFFPNTFHFEAALALTKVK